jgi:hypothetical protein
MHTTPIETLNYRYGDSSSAMPPHIPTSIRPHRPVSSGLGGSAREFRRAHADRRRRYDLRAAKRWGGLDLFNIPLPLLWLEQGCVPSLFEPDACAEQPITDLWP